MQSWLAVAVGGAIGSMARFWLSSLVAIGTGGAFPWGTLLVNVLGSFVIGLTAALTGPAGRIAVEPHWVLFVTVGLCGGFTTFSAFSLQTFLLMEEGRVLAAAGNILSSVVVCLVAVWLGWVAGR